MTKNIQYSKRYLQFLIMTFNEGWIASYNQIESQLNIEDSILLKISLLHPYHFNLNELNGVELTKLQEKIQGRRSFLNTNSGAKCSSNEIWGYDCPFSHEILVLDHDFPYSLGGPTDNAYNKRILCRWHNMIKGNDIHTYNWSNLFEDYLDLKITKRKHWVDIQIEKLEVEFKYKNRLK